MHLLLLPRTLVILLALAYLGFCFEDIPSIGDPSRFSKAPKSMAYVRVWFRNMAAMVTSSTSSESDRYTALSDRGSSRKIFDAN